MEEPLVSVVVPFYNVRECVGYCMKSLLSQTFEGPYEVLCVDDGSTDGTGELLDAYAEDLHVVVVHKQNGGVAEARNYGVECARADLISFVDGDDFVAPNYLEALYNALSETGAEIAVCLFEVVTLADAVNGHVFSKDDVTPVVRRRVESVEKALRGNPLQTTWGKIAARSIYLQHPFPSGRRYEDIAVFPEHFVAFESFAWIQSPLYGYVQRSGSVTKGEFAGHSQVADYLDAVAFAARGAADVLGENSPALLYFRTIENARIYRLAARGAASDSYLSEVRAECLAEIRVARASLCRDPGVGRGDKLRFCVLAWAPALYSPLMRLYERIVKGMR